jgi:hypothetical protein
LAFAIFGDLNEQKRELNANPHLKLQIALTWTIEGITLLTNTIWSDLSALLDLDIPLLSNSFYHQNFKSPTVY